MLKHTSLLALFGLSLLNLGCNDSNRVQTTSSVNDQGQTTYTTTYNTASGASYSSSQAESFFSTAPPYTATETPNQYLQLLFSQPYNPNMTLYIPNYTYFQGLAYSQGSIQMIGEVRLVGSLANTGTSNGVTLASGAMTTTDPDYLKNLVQPAHQRYAIVNWQEIP